jgi:hypothetical protein
LALCYLRDLRHPLPQDINITAIMDVFRIMARQEKIKPKVPDVPDFYEAMLRSGRRMSWG